MENISGLRLKELREVAELNELKEKKQDEKRGTKLTQEKFGEKFGVSGETQKSYENGNRNIPIDYAMKVCDEYHVTLDWLYGRSNYKNNTDIMVSIILALDKIMKIGYKTITNGDYENRETVLWIDKIFATYLHDIENLRCIYTDSDLKQAFPQLRAEIQKKYEKSLKELFDEEIIEAENDRFKDVKDIEIAELLTTYYED